MYESILLHDVLKDKMRDTQFKFQLVYIYITTIHMPEDVSKSKWDHQLVSNESITHLNFVSFLKEVFGMF